jgi:hypothetical protein
MGKIVSEFRSVDANLPRPARDWRPLAVAVGVVLAAVVMWVVALSLESPSRSQAARELVIAAASAPIAPSQAAGTPVAPAAAGGAIVARPSRTQQLADPQLFLRRDRSHVLAAWMAGFYPLYETASRTFAINWLLLASVHKQETAFSTDPTTYFGLNYAGCCGGPMQFNVTNRPVTTWSLVSDSFQYAIRPAGYPHQTVKHPSIYDDFDAMMAGARLLAANGAGPRLDGSAWSAAYSYYGHDATGVSYADQVIARAITWSQKGFCINCGLDAAMVDAVHAAYGAPMLAALTATPPKSHRPTTPPTPDRSARTARAR